MTKTTTTKIVSIHAPRMGSDAVEAVESVGLNYNVVKVPLAGLVQTDIGTQLILAENKVMIAREPTDDDPQYRCFGVAGPDYGIIQNINLARALDRLTKEWPVETVGALGKGETVFFTLDAGHIDIKGDIIHEYFLVTDTKDGKTTMRIAYTPVRVVCQNTLVLGLKEATISAALEHTPGIEGEVNFRVGLIEQMIKVKTQIAMSFHQMSEVFLNDDDLDFILEQAYPTPKKPAKAQLLETAFDELDIQALGDLYTEASEAVALWEYYCARAVTLRTAAKTLFEKINDEYPMIAGTPWAAYNAVVESADYRRGTETVQESALFGARAAEKKRAFHAAMEVTLSKLTVRAV